MAVANTVQATLRSNYEGAVDKGVKQTQAVMQQAFSAMQHSGSSLSSGLGSVFQSMQAGLLSWRSNLQQTAASSTSSFASISLGAAGTALALAALAVGAVAAFGKFTFELAKNASEALEVKLAFESLTATMGVQAGMAQHLKTATEGLVSGTTLLKNANRVLSADIPLTSEQYTKLVENVFKLSKAAGVDGAQAINTLTDSLIRGNARGFQAIGLNIGKVRDGISQMDEAMGQNVATVGNAARLQAFYADLLTKSSAAAARNAVDYVSMADAVEVAHRTYEGFVSSLGQAIGRSAVLEELLKRLTRALVDVGLGSAEVDSIALAMNRFMISMLRGVSLFVDAVVAAGPVLSALWIFIQGIFQAVVSGFAWLAGMLAQEIGRIVQLLALLPGAIGKTFEGLIPGLRLVRDGLNAVSQSAHDSLVNVFEGAGDGIARMALFADTIRATAKDMERFASEVIHGQAGIRGQAEAAAAAAEEVKKLAEQTKAYMAVLRQLGNQLATPDQRALGQFAETLAKIDELTLLSEAQRNLARVRAYRVYDAEIRNLELQRMNDMRQMETQVNEAVRADAVQGQKAAMEQAAGFLRDLTGQAALDAEALFDKVMADAKKKREEQRAQEVNHALATARAIEQAIEQSRRGKIDAGIGQEAMQQLPRVIADVRAQIAVLNSQPVITNEQIEQVIKLREQLDALNKLNFAPFQQAVQIMRQDITGFASQATQAFAAFFADIVSGQDGAGKKLLAAFVGMIGQMLVHIGVILVQAGIAEIVLAQTLVGKLMGASVAAGARAVAAGAALAVVGGIVQGAAANLARTNQAGPAASFQPNVPRPISGSQVQIIQVGAPGASRQPAIPAAPEPIEVRLKVESDEGVTVKHVENNYRNNGRLRVVFA